MKSAWIAAGVWVLLTACSATPRQVRGDLQIQGETLQAHATRLFVQGQYAPVLRNLETAERIWIQLDRQDDLAQNRYLMAQAWLAQGNAPAALKVVQSLEAIKASESTAPNPVFDPLREAALLRCRIEFDATHWDTARQRCAYALGRCNRCAAQSSIHTMQSRLALAEGVMNAARGFAQQALSLANGPLEKANAARVLGEIELATDHPVAAMSAFALALEADRQISQSRRIALDLLLLAQAARQAGQISTARDYASRGLAITEILSDADLSQRLRTMME